MEDGCSLARFVGHQLYGVAGLRSVIAALVAYAGRGRLRFSKRTLAQHLVPTMPAPTGAAFWLGHRCGAPMPLLPLAFDLRLKTIDPNLLYRATMSFPMPLPSFGRHLDDL